MNKVFNFSFVFYSKKEFSETILSCFILLFLSHLKIQDFICDGKFFYFSFIKFKNQHQ